METQTRKGSPGAGPVQEAEILGSFFSLRPPFHETPQNGTSRVHFLSAAFFVSLIPTIHRPLSGRGRKERERENLTAKGRDNPPNLAPPHPGPLSGARGESLQQAGLRGVRRE
eukprot:scaffold78700_cov32-Tisochrysis_lutea.AAC.7